MLSIFNQKFIQTLFTCNRPRLTMRRRTTFLLSLLAILLFATFSLHLSRNAISTSQPYSYLHNANFNTNENVAAVRDIVNHQTRRVSSVKASPSTTVSVLLPDWEILVLVSPNTHSSSSPDDHRYCLFPNNARSPASYSGVLPFTNRTTFKCDLPESVRRRRVFPQPMLVSGTPETESPVSSPAPELMRWNFLVYESFSTDDDVVVFAKGVNHRQGYDRSLNELRCVFKLADGGDSINTAVTSSAQEVFRCAHPDLDLNSDHALSENGNRIRISISLEIIGENLVIPSIAYYRPRPSREAQAQAQPKHFLCACTMVYNVAKFLREWVMYHTKVGVENFILYDNGSDDDFAGEVKNLRSEGYNITTLLWIWPKTQEAGFSHSVVYSKAKGLCNWIMYVDVDEFVYSPAWRIGDESPISSPSLKSMLVGSEDENGNGIRVGQVSMRCLEFGPSGQRLHPAEGVTRGYTCRRKVERRHKSIVLVEAVDRGLRNVVHHFEVKEGLKWKQVRVEEMLVNHYKYQAWDEFKSKFRRRVSAYVVDWKKNVNLGSKDRTPGLGFEAVEPEDWANKFCEVRDERLKLLTQAWFGSYNNASSRL
ncbi:glycosyltransferase family 92 protein RCOM_0530710 [Lotus japonicus]|uniref:glycosyltransferase family 92 protein RCOM_0530710 n=1 Tax=Lotus japonicus TaxID=34305 RepID=UPI002582AAA5|nr:glycosyltransferase family 92 protein RCOM_0530710 [Lotus japonicus]